MCGRFAASTPPKILAGRFAASEPGTALNWAPSWNVAPGGHAIVVVMLAGVRSLRAMRWGLVPPWAKSPAVGSRMINARAEGLRTSRAYAPALRKRRCLVPVDAFYEWAGPAPGVPRGRRQPYALRSAGPSPLALAGLWELWRDAEGVGLETFTIITTAANQEVARLHDRMPAIVAQGDWGRWLDSESVGPEEATSLLSPPPPGVLEIFPVSTAVGNTRNDGPALLQRVELAPHGEPPRDAELFPSGSEG